MELCLGREGAVDGFGMGVDVWLNNTGEGHISTELLLSLIHI